MSARSFLNKAGALVTLPAVKRDEQPRRFVHRYDRKHRAAVAELRELAVLAHRFESDQLAEAVKLAASPLVLAHEPDDRPPGWDEQGWPWAGESDRDIRVVLPTRPAPPVEPTPVPDGLRGGVPKYKGRGVEVDVQARTVLTASGPLPGWEVRADGRLVRR